MRLSRESAVSFRDELLKHQTVKNRPLTVANSGVHLETKVLHSFIVIKDLERPLPSVTTLQIGSYSGLDSSPYGIPNGNHIEDWPVYLVYYR